MRATSLDLISIVVPAYNEERRLPASIRDLRSFFGGIGIPVEIIVVIEKSTDATVEKARAAAENDPRVQIIANDVQRGKGYAVRCGMLRARGDLVFYMDADLSTPLAEVIRFLQTFVAHPEIDVLIGSRAEAKSRITKKQSWLRRNMGRGFNQLVQLFGVHGMQDTQCGFKAFRKNCVQPIFERTTIDGFAFDVEVLLLAQKMGLKIEALPVQWHNSEDSKVRMLIDPLKMAIDLIRVRYKVAQTLRQRPQLLPPTQL